mgnify:CR=1 FL=1
MSPEAAVTWKSSALTEDDRIVIQLWAKTIRQFGPDELQRHSGQWNDHTLRGHWAGCRASNFSNSGRVIYYRFEEHLIVEILRITGSHDYTKEGKL